MNKSVNGVKWLSIIFSLRNLKHNTVILFNHRSIIRGSSLLYYLTLSKPSLLQNLAVLHFILMTPEITQCKTGL